MSFVSSLRMGFSYPSLRTRPTASKPLNAFYLPLLSLGEGDADRLQQGLYDPGFLDGVGLYPRFAGEIAKRSRRALPAV